MELTWLFVYGLVFSLLVFPSVNGDTFKFDCYTDWAETAPLERLVLLNCTSKSLTSVAGLNTWLTQHPTFSKLLAEPKYDFVINYDSNNIQKVSPFPCLPRASVLSLKHNRIEEIENGAFTNLSNLNELDLSHNLLTGKALNAAVFRGPFNRELYEPLPIRILNLSGNQIHSFSRNAFEHLQFLERLDLDNNPIKIVDHTTQLAFSALTKLKWLDIGYTQLKTIPGELLQHTPIETLFLNGNKLEVVPKLAELQRTLTTLNLNDNLMMEVNAGDFSALGNLADLEMNGMSRLRRIRSGSFAQLKSLERFVCSYNPLLTDIGDNLFHHAPDEVKMRNNALSTLAKNVTKWESVRNLDVQSNPWTCDCQIGWLVSLLAVRSYVDHEYYMDVKCAEPDWLRGYRLDSLFQHFTSSCRFTPPASSLQHQSSTGNQTKLQITSFVAVIFIAAAVLAFFIRGGRIPLRKPRFLKNEPSSSRLQTGSVQSSIRYQKADNNDKVCEMIEYKREYTNECV